MSKNNNKTSYSLKIIKTILLITTLLSVISIKLLVIFVAKLFSTPIKYRIPKRELKIDSKI